ncbi:MAG TPA: redoxin family protein [Bryobacteraceae bacterium]|nr:redoxin family protein [Bryobacteraceae bacterium]
MQQVQEEQKFGEALEDFTLQNVRTGKPLSLSQALTGKRGAVVVFWSGVCSHCVRYDTFLGGFEKRHPELAFIAVASRHGETLDSIQAAVIERRLHFAMVHDPGGKIAAKWFTQQTPRTFLMDASRRLIYRGAIDNFKYPEDPEFAGYLEPAIDQFLKGEPIARTETASYGCAIQSVYYILPRAL